MRRMQLVYLALGLGALLASLLLTPAADGHLALFGLPLPSFCALRNLFDLSCPTCGMTRAFAHAARLDPGAAWGANPAGLALFLLLVGQIPYRTTIILRAVARDRGSAWPRRREELP